MELYIGLLFFLSTLVCIQGQYGHRYLGCYKDSRVGRRILPVAVYNEDNYNRDSTTVEYCVMHCGQLSYKYAGLQYYSECRCGNSSYGNKDAVCNTPCKGNSSQICGGAWANSVYEIVRATTSTPTTTTSTPTTTTTTPTTTAPITTTTTTTTSTASLKPTKPGNLSSAITSFTEVSTSSAAFAHSIQPMEATAVLDNDNKDGDENVYVTIGVIAVCAILVIVVVLVVVLVIHRRRNAKKTPKSSISRSFNHISYSSHQLESNQVVTANPPTQPESGAAAVKHHVTAKGDVYALVNKVKAPADAAKPEYSVTNEQREDNIYINSTDNSAIYCNTTQTYNHDQPTDHNRVDDQIYSLAQPIIEDLVVVDNQLYE